jgi:predicted nucleotide-binding protein
MMKPTKAQAKDRIQRARDSIPGLQLMQRFSPEFTRWRLNTQMAIGHTFGESSRHFATFTSIKYSPSIVVADISEEQLQGYYAGVLEATADLLQSMIDEIEEYWPHDAQASTEAYTPMPNSNRVFVVHGRDEAATQTVARYIEGLGLEPVILQERPNEGRTIIEKFEEYAETVGFAIILGTPDDVRCFVR